MVDILYHCGSAGDANNARGVNRDIKYAKDVIESKNVYYGCLLTLIMFNFHFIALRVIFFCFVCITYFFQNFHIFFHFSFFKYFWNVFNVSNVYLGNKVLFLTRLLINNSSNSTAGTVIIIFNGRCLDYYIIFLDFNLKNVHW